MSARYIVIQASPTDQQWDWYIVDLVTKACVDRVSGGYAQVTDRVARMNRGDEQAKEPRHTHSVTQPPEVTCAHPAHRSQS